MRTRNFYFPNNSSVTIPRRRNKRHAPNIVEPELRTIVEVAPIADYRTMDELLQAPTEGCGESIVIPEINADHFEIKTNFLKLVQANPYHGFEIENPHTHINNFKRITLTLKFKDVSNDVIKLMMFPYSLEGAARVCKTDDRIDKLADQISTLVDIFAKKVVTPATVKAVEESCVTCGGNHAYYNYDATNSNQSSVCTAMVKRRTEETTDKEQTNFQGSTAHIQSLVIPISKPDVSKTLPKPNIPYPLRLNDQKLHEKTTNQMDKFFQFFQDFHFNISFTDALLLMPKFASTIKSLLANKDKLFELAKISLNENCSAMLLKKLPEKLGDLEKFLIPCDFPGMDVCHSLADLGASINLMPLSILKKISLPELTHSRMTLELADRSITRRKGVAEDVFVKVGKFYFLTDLVVVDFKADPRVPLILGRSFLRTGRALIDVYREEITLQVNDKAVTFNLNQTTRYSSTYDDMSVNRIDVIDVVREEYAQEILGFSNNSSGGNPTSTFEPIISDSSLSLTPFEGSDFILEVIEAYLKDESILPKIDHANCVDKLPVIIAKDLKDDEKEALLKVLKSHKQAIAWKITDIKGIGPHFCTQKILMDEDYKHTVQSKRRVNPKIHEIARPMTYLLEKETPFVFSKDCIDAFETLKKKLTEASILVVPDWNLPFELVCDASNFAIGVVLGQRKTKHFQPILYASKTMTEAQIHYTTTEKEMLAYLLSKQDAKPRLLRWVLLIQEFDIIIRDKKGTENLAAEHLSRLENPHKDVFENKDINENFPLETLGKISSGMDRSITRPKGIAKDIFIKVGKFYFLTDFVVVDFEADPRVPLILGRSFLRTGRALINVYGEEITLWVNDEAYGKGSDFILEEIEAYLKDESISLELDHADYDPEGDICLNEKLLNDDPFQLPPMDLKQGKLTKEKSSIEEPSELKLKYLPSHLEYAYLEGLISYP
nr:reverse transcriptase domain-containing protein [Tanacetum cinerariifolium]